MTPTSSGCAVKRRGLFRKATIARINDDGETVERFSLYAAAGGGGANMAFRTQRLRELGGFDERLGAGTPAQGGEDIMVWISLAWPGHSLGFEPAALGLHVHRREDDALERQIASYGVGFAATMVALVFDDPRHLAAIIATSPRALAALSRAYWHRLRPRRRADSQPATEDAGSSASIAGLARLELLGMLRGPGAYLISAAGARRQTAR